MEFMKKSKCAKPENGGKKQQQAENYQGKLSGLMLR